MRPIGILCTIAFMFFSCWEVNQSTYAEEQKIEVSDGRFIQIVQIINDRPPVPCYTETAREILKEDFTFEDFLKYAKMYRKFIEKGPSCRKTSPVNSY